MVSLTSEEISTIKTVLDRDSVDYAMLFGSRVSGECDEDSDIDIMIKFNIDEGIFTELYRIEKEYEDNGNDSDMLDLVPRSSINDDDLKLLESISEGTMLVGENR